MSLNTYGFADDLYMKSKSFDVSVSAKDKIIQVMDGNVLLASLSMELNNNILSLIGKDNMTVAEVLLPNSQTISKESKYDPETNEIVIVVDMSDGTTDEIRIDVSDLIMIYEGCDGIEVNGNKIGIKINENSSKYLSADDSGLSINMDSLDDTFATDEDLEKYATIEMVEDVKNTLSAYATKDDISDMATMSWVNEQGYLTEHQDISHLVNKDEFSKLEETVSNKVDWTNVSTEENTNRKAIVLGNHDTILGTTTSGGTVNIAMVSKWDKVDLGTSTLPINLNGNAERPTYNDDKQIALYDDIVNADTNFSKEIEELKKKDSELENSINNEITVRGEKDNELQLNLEQEADARESKDSELEILINKESETRGEKDSELQLNIENESSERIKSDLELSNKLDNKVDWTSISTEENPNRKAIVLGNHDTILGSTTSGGTVNVAMVSKWDKVDLGTSTLPINLNGNSERPTYNDNKEIALLDDIVNSDANFSKEIEELKKKDSELEDSINNESIIRNDEDTKLNNKIDQLHQSTNDELVSINDLINSIELVKSDDSDLIYNLIIGDINKGTINIPKDQFLKQVTYDNLTNILTFIITTSSGIDNKIDIDLTDLVDEYNAGNGLKLDSKTFSILIDENSDKYLTLSENGLKLSGVDEELKKYSTTEELNENFATKQELNNEIERAKSEELKLLGSESDDESVLSLYGVKKYASINKGDLTEINIKIDTINSSLDNYITKDEAVIEHDKILNESKTYTNTRINDEKPNIIIESVNQSKAYTDEKYNTISANLTEHADRILSLETRCDHFDTLFAMILDEHGDPIKLNFYTKEEANEKFAFKTDLENKVEWVQIGDNSNAVANNKLIYSNDIELIQNQINELKEKLIKLENQLSDLIK